MGKSSIDALIVTYKRPEELARLISSLLAGSVRPRQIVVVDNSPSLEASAVCREFDWICRYIPTGRNVGVGAGFNIALRSLAERPPEFVCALDDDCVVSPTTLQSCAEALATSKLATFAAPLITDGKGSPSVCPGFVRKKDTRHFKKTLSFEALKKMSGAPLRWATGVCLFYRYHDALRVGLYREDCWVLGEDVEFTMRISHQENGIFVGDEVAHIPPNGTREPAAADRITYVKFLALITNISFFAIYLPHARREIPSIPKLIGRFVLTAPSISKSSKLWDAARAAWIGAARAQPAGREIFERQFKSRYAPDF